ncbi:hypothetical protein BU17DRAFT_68706 [Hysterangium stoloniferum]|nr:hypothetical protein BU17DRAFT_68706 [Hysterangium stoloniferum]
MDSEGINNHGYGQELPPTVSPSAAVIIPDSQLRNDNITRAMRAYKMLREQWGCDELGHDLCLQGNDYIGHIQLSEEQISILIGEICRGQATCRYPPEVFIVPERSGSNRDPSFDRGGSGTTAGAEVEKENAIQMHGRLRHQAPMSQIFRFCREEAWR